MNTSFFSLRSSEYSNNLHSADAVLHGVLREIQNSHILFTETPTHFFFLIYFIILCYRERERKREKQKKIAVSNKIIMT